jgi:hypothetical protein
MIKRVDKKLRNTPAILNPTKKLILSLIKKLSPFSHIIALPVVGCNIKKITFKEVSIMSMKTRGVAFNLEDPAQADLYKYTQEFKNFSAYVKNLIERDRAVRKPAPAPAQKIVSNNNGGIRFTVGG